MSRIVESIPAIERKNAGRKPAHDYGSLLSKALAPKVEGRAVELTKADLPDSVKGEEAIAKFHSALRRFGRSHDIQVVTALRGGKIYLQAGNPAPRVYTRTEKAEVAEEKAAA